jgi:hypothetical protein
LVRRISGQHDRETNLMERTPEQRATEKPEKTEPPLQSALDSRDSRFFAIPANIPAPAAKFLKDGPSNGLSTGNSDHFLDLGIAARQFMPAFPAAVVTSLQREERDL